MSSGLRKIIASALISAGVFCSVPALAATTISFAGGSTDTHGTAGQILPFSNGGISVQASGWSYNAGTRQIAYLGDYSLGLGITDSGEGNGNTNNSHTIDNLGQADFVLLVFNQSVNISSAVLSPFSLGAGATDNDVTVSYASLSGAFTSPATPVAVNNAIWTTLTSHSYTVSGNNSSPYSTLLNSAGKYGNVWLIGAAQANPDSNYDGFKLTSVTVAAVPEVSTWMMMIVGLAVVGGGMRSIRRKEASQSKTKANVLVA